jgi:hypothetical protein
MMFQESFNACLKHSKPYCEYFFLYYFTFKYPFLIDQICIVIFFMIGDLNIDD